MALFVWGSNNTQQLGLDDDDATVFDVRRVTGLQGHALVDFSAGEQHSLAVDEVGQVFAWGRGKEGQLGVGKEQQLLREPQRVEALDAQVITHVACGDSHSLALSVTGEVFMWGLLPEARKVQNDGTFDHATVSLTGLEDMREQGDAAIMARLVRDSETIYESQRMTKHDLEDTETSLEHLTQRKVETVRFPCFVPRLCASLRGVKIVSIAAGFAHSLAVSSTGRVFSCGYNDNGQLGIGSRRNCAEFTPVANLDNVVITQVACGQQHSLACSRLDPLQPSISGLVFSWGLGILGQLGLGVNISWLPMQVTLDHPVRAIAAGSHHSVAVTEDGAVYTWGHSEYGQHGAGEQHRDLQNELYYFFPRLQESLHDDGVRIEQAACSSHSTFAVTRDGRLYSWGWNAFGVLGVGKVKLTAHPQCVTALGDGVALHVGAGSNHCGVIVRHRGCHYSLKYSEMLHSAEFTDVVFVVDNGRTRIPAHQVVVCARSAYLNGLLRMQRRIQNETSEKSAAVMEVDAFQDVEMAVFRSMLHFLYTNTVVVAPHKRQALLRFAKRVCLDELTDACQVTWKRERPPVSDGAQEHGHFESDMQRMVLSEEFADVVFLWPVSNDDEDEWAEEESKDEEEHVHRLPAHKVILSQVEYFHSLFSDRFREGRQSGQDDNRVHEIALHHMPQDGISLAAFRGLLTWIYTGSLAFVQQFSPHEMMDMYVAASLMSMTVLANLCEMQLIALLPSLEDDEASLSACVDFASEYDAQRLLTMSKRALALANSAFAEGNEELKIDEE